MEYNTLKVEIADYVAVVTLNRPPVNAQNAENRAEITELFDLLSDMDEVRVIVLTGSGKVFSAGADIRERPNLAGKPGAYAAWHANLPNDLGHHRAVRFRWCKPQQSRKRMPVIQPRTARQHAC